MSKPALATALMIAMIGTAADAGRAPRKKTAAVETSDAQPLVRMRNAPRDAALTPLQFGDWMRAQWRKGMPRRYALTKTPTARLNTMSEDFRLADNDGDGRVSATELADYLAFDGRN